MKGKKRFPVILSCGHETIHTDLPRLLQEVVCFRCACARLIVFVRKYTAECEDCNYKNHEGDLSIADARGWQHCESRSHRVKLWYPSADTPVILIPSAEHVLLLRATA